MVDYNAFWNSSRAAGVHNDCVGEWLREVWDVGLRRFWNIANIDCHRVRLQKVKVQPP